STINPMKAFAIADNVFIRCPTTVLRTQECSVQIVAARAGESLRGAVAPDYRVAPDHAVPGCSAVAPNHGVAPDYGCSAEKSAVAPDHRIAPNHGIRPDRRGISLE